MGEFTKTEHTWETILQGITDPVLLLSKDLKILWANKAFQDQCGCTIEEIVGTHCYKLTHHREAPCEPPHDICPVSESEKTGTMATTIHTHFDREGNKIFVEASAYPVKDEKGEMEQFVCMYKDITEMKRVEEELRKAHDELEKKVQERTVELSRTNRTLMMLNRCNQTMVHSTNELDLLHDICTIIVDIGGYRMAWVGFAEHDEAKSVRPVAHAGYEEGYLETLNITWADTERGRGPTGTAIRTGKPCIEKDITRDAAFAPWRASAMKRGYESSIAIPLIARGQAFGTLNIYASRPDTFDTEEIKLLTELADDVVYALMALRTKEEYRQTVTALQESERRYRVLIEQASDGIFIVDKQLNVMDVNSKACTMLGYNKDDFLHLNVKDFAPPEEHGDISLILNELLSGETVLSERKVLRKDGTRIDVEISAKMLDDGRIQTIVRDITKRKETEETVRAEWQRFQDVLDQLPAYLVLLTPDYHISFANRFFRERFGESHGRRCYEYLFNRPEPCEICETYSVLKTNAPHHWEWTGPDGRNYDIYDFPFKDTDGSTLIMEVGLDITERKDSEKRDRVINNLMELFATKHTRKEYLDSVVQVIKEWCGCRYVGIRVLDKDGNIPYESHTGFSEEFLRTENFLSVKHDTCACIRVITGKLEPQDASVMTSAGSFFCTDINKFVTGLTDEEHRRFRGACISAGYSSVAIIPVRYREKILGAIHLADERKDMIPLNRVDFIESIAPLVGEAIYRFTIEEELKRSEASLSEAQRIVHLGNWNWNIQTNELRWSDEIYRIFGLTPQQFYATYGAFLSCVHPDDRELVKKAVHEALHERKPYSIDHRIVLPDGSVRTVHEQAEVESDDAGNPVRMIGTVQDITERKGAEEELKRSREELRNLSAYLQSLREEERTHIAREIHDELGQALTALKMDIFWLSSRLPKNKKPLFEKAKSISTLIDTTVKAVRKISAELRPEILDHLGLTAAFEWQVEEFRNRTGIKCALSIKPEEISLDRDLATAVFRMLQEMLTNVARHAMATSVSIHLKEKEDLLLLKVSDNGKGITKKQLSDVQSFGLIGIRERARQWGGEVDIKGIRNKGTTVTVSIPLKKQGEKP